MALFPTRNWPSWTAALRDLTVKLHLKVEIFVCALRITLLHESAISRILKNRLGLRIDLSLAQIHMCAYGIKFSRHLIKAEMNGVFFRRWPVRSPYGRTNSFMADPSCGQTVAGEVRSVINACRDPNKMGEVSVSPA